MQRLKIHFILSYLLQFTFLPTFLPTLISVTSAGTSFEPPLLNFSLNEILNSDLLQQVLHGFSILNYSQLSDNYWNNSLESDDLKFLCGRIHHLDAQLASYETHFFYSNSKEELYCSLTTLPLANISKDLQLIHLPHFFKIQPNILAYLTNTSNTSLHQNSKSVLAIQFTPTLLSKDVTLKEVVRDIFNLHYFVRGGDHFQELFSNPFNISLWSKFIKETLLSLDDDDVEENDDNMGQTKERKTWLNLNQSISSHCPVYSTLRLLLESLSSPTSNFELMHFTADIRMEVYGNSLHIYGFPNSFLSPACVGLLVHSASLSPFVVSIEVGEDAHFMNSDGSSSIQSNRKGLRPYHDAGLQGLGQICGIADSGVNDLSCFFEDDSDKYHTRSTSRSWEMESLRRKIVQYVPYADSVDDEGGHGTHTCGTLAGSSKSVFEEENGVAPQAKIAFFDIGFSLPPFPIVIPRLHSVLFPSSYSTGARVHSNSWAGGLPSYAEYSLEVDTYLYENPDFLVVLAAGNRGHFGPGTIGSPANSKNALCVGSTQIRSSFDDSLFSFGPSVSTTSSFGPTLDGRYKPDVLAVGEGVLSAYSSSIDNQYDAQHLAFQFWSKDDLMDAWNSLTTCAVHEKSGTSMATPLISGAALLIRQYFMDSKFWASICLKSYQWCKSFEPSGYLLKALILHSCEGVRHSSPPDIFQGYGAFGLQNILPLKDGNGLNPSLNLIIYDQIEIAEHSVLRFNLKFLISESTSPVKITICWFDPPSLIGLVSHLLIHDIDIVLLSPLGDVVAWGNNATGGDQLNPNEQIFLFAPDCSLKSQIHNNIQTSCNFTLLIRSHALPFKRLGSSVSSNNITQALALVLTTSATVSGPEIVNINLWPTNEQDHHHHLSTTVERDETSKEQQQELQQLQQQQQQQQQYQPRAEIEENCIPAALTDKSFVVIDFISVPLDVSSNGSGLLTHPVVPIATFQNKIVGSRLDSVSLRLSPFSIPPIPLRPVPLIGLDAYLLTVTIVDPTGLATEIGGLDCPTRSDEFYLRYWPTIWTTYAIPEEGEWRATRNVSTSGLGKTSSSNSPSYLTVSLPSTKKYHAADSHSDWSVSLSVGYKDGIRPLFFYTGSVTLHFTRESKEMIHPSNSNNRQEEVNLHFTFLGDINKSSSSSPSYVVSSSSSTSLLRIVGYFFLSSLALAALIACFLSLSTSTPSPHQRQRNAHEGTPLLSFSSRR